MKVQEMNSDHRSLAGTVAVIKSINDGDESDDSPQ
jgi:hypothetical protein